jgi:nucleotide-binding universal stress UspA family protein
VARIRHLLARRLSSGRRRVRRVARRIGGRWRMVLVPLLEPEHTRHALALACRLAAERRTRLLLVAPLYVEWELPLDAHFRADEARLHEELERERALAESYGVATHVRTVRVRPGELGGGVAAAARDVGASLIVLGAPAASQRGFRRPFSRDVWSVLDAAPCPVMIATGSPLRRAALAA